MKAASSIRSTLLLWLCAGLGLAISLVAIALFFQAREEANQLFDYQMQQVASALPSRFLPHAGAGGITPFAATPNVVIQIWDPTGVRLYVSHDLADMPQRAVPGFSTLEVQNQKWRVYTSYQGATVVQIAQPLQVRSDMAARSALKTVAPLLLLVPFLGGLVWVAVGRGLAPIHGVAVQLAARDAGQLSPVSDDDLPDEIRPLTQAVNGLLKRLDEAASAQKIFVDDAAHELRTPLTALQLQVALAERACDTASRAVAFFELRAGLARASHLVQQLLTLARHEPGVASLTLQIVDLAEIARQAVVDLAMQADAREIDLGITRSSPALVRGDPDALRILLTNLLDNAVKATAPRGRVDLAVDVDVAGKRACLTVDDTGPGIVDSELTRVFDRFYRSPAAPPGGSGLGLSIVRRIADVHGAEVSLTNLPAGLRARLSMALSV